MRIKDVETTLSKEMDSIIRMMPNHLADDFKKYAYFAGGCIYCLYNDKEPKDYDIFLGDQVFANTVEDYFRKQIGSKKSRSGFIKGKYKGLSLLISEYAITIGKYQIVIKYYGKPDEVVEQFDFRHNMFSFYDDRVKNHTEWENLTNDELIFNDSRARDICGTILRIPKFVERGWKISRKELAKMLKALDINGFDDNERRAWKNVRFY